MGTPSYRSFSATATGISHIKNGKGCEDYSLHYESAQIAFAVAADGHGDENYFRSAKGAEAAAAVAKDAVIQLNDTLRPRLLNIINLKQMPAKKEFEKFIHDLIKYIIKSWRDKVETDYTDNPFTEEELANVGEKYRKRYDAGQSLHHAYGTTLIAAAATKEYWFGIHIGDGRFTVLYRDGTFGQPVPWDERCFLNVTTSLCDDDASDSARIGYALAPEQLPAAFFLCSDGVDDNYPVEENEKHLYKLYRLIVTTFAEEGFDSTCRQLKDLAGSFATKGKGDDTSIAGIIDMEAVKDIERIWKQEEAEDQKAAKDEGVKAAAVGGAAAAIEAYKKQIASECKMYGGFENHG
ncbi:MAG: protein phosphatase 2C domain-containing protein [Treponema sp.]|jgi:serine/threonine protein phosphatase PrpC|nr:protein phosphatase 2C domain-containing protein [Treponema sp.]